ncbi:hypothetical protein BJX64DRAFT_293341 [Aspergillus heterothallicus]
MEVLDLQLAVPDIHFLREPCDYGQAPPIAGSIEVALPTLNITTATANVPRVSVGLVQCVKLHAPYSPSTTTKTKETKRHMPRFWKQSAPNKPTPHCKSEKSRTLRRIVAQSIICHAPDETVRDADGQRTWLKFHFHLPIPNNLPGTLQTIGGDVSYVIEAQLPDQQQLPVLQPVKIQHYTQPRTISHLRRYPGDLVTTELYIAPSSSRKGISYSAEWLARSTVTHGARPSDVKYVVAKELHWSIEETVKGLSVTRETTTCMTQYTRRLSEGLQKGRWVASGGVHEEDDSIRIAFDIVIPSGITTSDTTTMPSHQHQQLTSALESQDELLTVAVDHRLNLEVVVGEDTFHSGTGDLLDRRYPVRSYKATFPLLIRHFIFDSSVFPVGGGELPPRYEEPYVAPPEY